jgi:PqqD family protein of HPr-rel-A system
MECETAAPLYSCAAPGPLLEHWGDYASVYNGATGDTHLLSLLPAELLTTLMPGPLDLTRIATRMAQLCGQPESPEWTERMLGLLEQLCQLELVDRTPG